VRFGPRLAGLAVLKKNKKGLQGLTLQAFFLAFFVTIQVAAKHRRNLSL